MMPIVYLFILVLFLLAIISAGCDKQNQSVNIAPYPAYNYTHQLKVGGQILMVEISTTPAQMQEGLSDRVSMADNQGMLFDFSARGGSASGGSNAVIPAFWMKDMKFNLDFIWIAQNPSTGSGQVVGITADAPRPNSPSDPLPNFYPPEPVSQVLEVNAGWAQKNSVHVGDEVSWQ